MPRPPHPAFPTRPAVSGWCPRSRRASRHRRTAASRLTRTLATTSPSLGRGRRARSASSRGSRPPAATCSARGTPESRRAATAAEQPPAATAASAAAFLGTAAVGAAAAAALELQRAGGAAAVLAAAAPPPDRTAAPAAEPAATSASRVCAGSAAASACPGAAGAATPAGRRRPAARRSLRRRLAAEPAAESAKGALVAVAVPLTLSAAGDGASAEPEEAAGCGGGSELERGEAAGPEAPTALRALSAVLLTALAALELGGCSASSDLELDARNFEMLGASCALVAAAWPPLPCGFCFCVWAGPSWRAGVGHATADLSIWAAAVTAAFALGSRPTPSHNVGNADAGTALLLTWFQGEGAGLAATAGPELECLGPPRQDHADERIDRAAATSPPVCPLWSFAVPALRT